MNECVCLRCGNKLVCACPVDLRNRHEKRPCSDPLRRCRSPLWNKPYQRRISPERRNAGSHFDALALPLLAHAGVLPSHDAGWVKPQITGFNKRPGVVSRKPEPVAAYKNEGWAARALREARAARDKTISPSVKSPRTGSRKTVTTSLRRRAAATLAKSKHGKTKGTKCQD